MSVSVLPLSMLAHRKPCGSMWAPSTDEMPPFLQVAEWEDGTKIWRAMEEKSANRLHRYILQDSTEVPWKDLGYDNGRLSMFGVTVELDGHDIPVGFFVVSTYAELDHVPVLHALKIRDPFRHEGIYLDDSIQGVNDIAPRRLGHQVAWFLLEALQVDPELVTETVPNGIWERLKIPSPIADRFFDEDTYSWGVPYRQALEAWRQEGRFADLQTPSDESDALREKVLNLARDLVNDMVSLGKNFPRNGPFRAARATERFLSAMKFQVTAPNSERFDVMFHVSEMTPGYWSISWLLNARRAGVMRVPLQSSEVSLMDALQRSGIVWPESTYEQWLDEHLVPGRIGLSESTVEAYALLGVSTPLLLPPEALWAIAMDNAC